MSYKNKGKRQDAGAANADGAQNAKDRMQKQQSNVSAGSITSTNRFAAFG